MASLFVSGRFQLIGGELGTLETYAAGTTTPLVTYTTQAGDVPNPTTINLDANGRASVWLGSAAYRMIGKSALGVTIYDVDNIRGETAADLPVADAGDLLAGAGVEAALAELALSRKKLVNVADYPWLCDMTGATDSSAAFFAAQTYARSIGAGVYVPAGILTAAIDLHYDNAAILGAGSAVTEIRLPITTVAVTSISTASNILTVLCNAAHGVWVGKSVRLAGTSNAAHNSGFIVTVVDSAMQFKCQQLNTTVTGASTGGVLMASSVVECGKLCDGNSAPAYSGLVLRGFTANGRRGLRATPESDLTDWGVALTAFSHYNITDVRAKDCWQGGVAAFINSNYGHFQAYAENCGFSAAAPGGFEINSSKFFSCDVVTKDCNYGAKIVDNCWGVTGKISVANATVIGVVLGNQTVNESHGLALDLAVEGGCSSDGVQIGTNLRGSTIRAAVAGVTGIGVREVYLATAAHRPGSNVITASTKGCGGNGAVIGGDRSTWTVTSYLDGRTGAAGSSYAVLVSGTGNQIAASITDSSTPQVRGVSMDATSSGNHLLSLSRNTLVSDYMDAGTGNRFNSAPLRGTKTAYAPGAIAAGAQVSTTITVTGAATGRGDFAHVRYGDNSGGLVLFGEVTAANTVTAYITNETAGSITPASATLYAVVVPGVP